MRGGYSATAPVPCPGPTFSLGERMQDDADAALGARRGLPRLADAVVAVASDLDLTSVLQTIVEAAQEMTGARYGALGVLGLEGGLDEFVHTGMSNEVVDAVGHLPQGEGILGLLMRETQTLRLSELGDHPASSGFPEGHPPMGSFLGTPVRVRGKVFGNIYLTEKQAAGGFTSVDEQQLEAFAAVAGVAIENARLYARAQQREQLLGTIREVTLALLAGTDADDVLIDVAGCARQLADAALATIAMPRGDGALELRAVDGALADSVREAFLARAGSVFDEVIQSGAPARLADVAADARVGEPIVALAELGPALVVPLTVRSGSVGTLLVARKRGAAALSHEDCWLVETLAAQASVAFQYGQAREKLQHLQVVGERERIARNLHDTVIGRLFGLGMNLEAMTRSLAQRERAEIESRVSAAVDELDETIREIRTAIFALSAPQGAGLADQLASAVASAERMLGFAPTLRLDGPVGSTVPEEVQPHVVAVLREALTNAARHAKGTRVEVSLQVSDELRLCVDDDGVGLPDGRSAGHGLHNIAERAEQLGGIAELTDAPQGGTRVTWKVPLTSGASRA